MTEDRTSSEDSGDGGPGEGGVASVLRTVTPDFVRKRFALKFALVLLVMGLAIGAIGAAATAQVTDQTQQRIENEYSNLANQEGNLMEQWLERNILSVRLSSGNDVWASAESQSLQLELRRKVSQDLPGDTVGLHVLNRTESGDLRVVASSTEERQPDESVAASGLSWTADEQFAGQNGVAVSDVYVTDTDGGTPVIGFMSPVVAGDGGRYLVQEVGLTELSVQMQGNESAAGGYTQVVNASGSVLVDERSTEAGLTGNVLGQYGDESAREPIRQAQQLGDRPSGVIADMSANDDVIDEEYAVGYARVAPGGITEWDKEWVVLVHAPSSSVFGFVQTVSEWGYIATAAGVLLIGLIGAALGYNTATSIDRLTAKAEAIEDGDLDVAIRSHRVDNIGQLYDAFASMRDSLKRKIEEAEQARKEAEVSRAEAMEMNEYLQDKAEEYSEIMRACGRGDLTRRMEPDDENDAMDQIAEEFNEMIAELEMTTGQLKTFAVEVEEGGRGVQESAETVRDASEQVADSIQKISDDAYDQKERLRDISSEMDAIAEQLETVADDHPDVDVTDSLETIRSIAGMIDEAAQLGEQTMDESESVAGAAEEQAAELNEVSSRAQELVRYAQYLGDGLNNFETEDEHEFVFQTGAGGSEPGDEPQSDE